jgi:hypothetical protein
MTDIIAISFDEFSATPTSEDAFAPAIYDVEGDGVTYFDGRMSASVSIDHEDGVSALRISTWDSAFPANGHSRMALEWLRERFDRIVVLGAGELDGDGVGDIATSYWQHMRASGLADVILLDDGAELAPDSVEKPGMAAR